MYLPGRTVLGMHGRGMKLLQCPTPSSADPWDHREDKKEPTKVQKNHMCTFPSHIDSEADENVEKLNSKGSQGTGDRLYFSSTLWLDIRK